jgi:hypothetical protein
VTPLYLAATVALILGAIELACRWTDRHMPDPADAQPDYTPPDEPDPVDAADDTLPDLIRRLRDDMTACEPDGWVLDFYTYLDKERSK